MAAGDGVLGGGRGGAAFPVSDDYVVMALQASTQIDGFGHVGGDGSSTTATGPGSSPRRAARGGSASTTSRAASSGARCCSTSPRHLGVEHLEPGFPIGPDELDGAASRAGRVGRRRRHRARAHRSHQLEDRTRRQVDPDARSRHEPGISIRAIPWLHDHDVAMIATDTAACQVVPAEPGDAFLTWHVAALRDLGLLVGELFDLDELAADCAADGVYEGFFVAAPMPVVGASGSPLNPIVIK